MGDFITHMLVKCFYEYHAKIWSAVVFALLPRKFFLDFVKTWVRPWDCVAHVNVIRHVRRGGKKIENCCLTR
jgi:hypothetical protein